MATATETLQMILSAKDQATSVFSRFGASIITVNQGLQLLTSIARGASSAIDIVTGFLQDAARASDEAQLATVKLETTLKSTSQFSPQYVSELQSIASELQNLTGQSDEAILSVSRQLIAMGASRDQIRRLTIATLDLAAGMGEGEGGAAGAALLLGKAVAGEFGTLSRYGIFVNENASATEKLNQALLQIEQRFGGQAQAKMQTFGGQVNLLTENYGDLKELIGEAITSSEAFFALFEEGNAIILEAQQFIKNNKEEIRAWVKEGLLIGADGLRILNDLLGFTVTSLSAVGVRMAGLNRGDFSVFFRTNEELVGRMEEGFFRVNAAIDRLRTAVGDGVIEPASARRSIVDIQELNRQLAETDALIRRINAQGGIHIGGQSLSQQLQWEKLTTNSPD